jgi:hypothetical protein
VADSSGWGVPRESGEGPRTQPPQLRQREQARDVPRDCGALGVLGDAQHDGSPEIRELGETEEAGRLREPEGPSDPLGRGGVADADVERGKSDGRGGGGEGEGAEDSPGRHPEQLPRGGGASGKLGDAHGGRQGLGGRDGPEGQAGQPSAAGDFWSECDWLPCRDGKRRAVEPRTLPLAHGVPRRVELLKGYGNAIVPQVAAEFVKALIG